jgi:hypothetical protein
VVVGGRCEVESESACVKEVKRGEKRGEETRETDTEKEAKHKQTQNPRIVNTQNRQNHRINRQNQSSFGGSFSDSFRQFEVVRFYFT